ncbi:MAG: hypothetical protein WKG00_35645 [Polyangiaceae bacterium]
MRGVGIVGNSTRTPSTPPSAPTGQLAQQAPGEGLRADAAPDGGRSEQPIESQAPRRRLRVVTRCADIDEFMAAFAPFTDETSLFVVTTAPRPVGPRQPFVIQLRDGTSVLSGEGDVVESLHDPDAPVRGMRVRLLALDEDGRRMHEALLAHAASQVGGVRGAAAGGQPAVCSRRSRRRRRQS